MPGIDGLQFLQAIRKRGDTTPLILLTGHGSEEIAAEAFRLGADDYCTKEEGFARYERLLKAIQRVIFVHEQLQQKQAAEEALRKSEEKFRTLSENSQDFITRYSKQCRHLYINRAGSNVIGLPAEEIVGKTHRELGYNEELCRLLEGAIQRVFLTGEPQKEIFEFEGTQGRVVLDWRVFPEFSKAGKVETALGFSRDITELHKTEEQLKSQRDELDAANRELEAFGYSVSHDLKAPLRHIEGYCEVLLEQDVVELNEPGYDYIHRIRSCARNAKQLISDIMKRAQRQATYQRYHETLARFQGKNKA